MRFPIYYLFQLLVVIVSCNVHAQNLSSPVRVGLIYGAANGDASVSNDARNDFNNNNGFGPTLGIFAEKSISPLFSATVGAQAVFSWSPDLFKSSTSAGYFLSTGGVLGRVTQTGHGYLSFAIGLSFIDIGDSGAESEPGCFILCSAYRQGGQATGTGYRVAIGRTFRDQARAEIAYINLTGEGDDFPAGSKALFSAVHIVGQVFIK